MASKYVRSRGTVKPFQQLQVLLPLEWIYQEHDSSTSDEQKLTLPPEEELDVLQKASRIGDIQGIRRALDSLEIQGSQFFPFCERPPPLANTFQIRRIRDFLHSYRQPDGQEAQPTKRESPPVETQKSSLTEHEVTAALRDVDTEVLHALEQAALTANIRIIEQQIARIREMSPLLGNALAELAAKFDYRAILHYLKKVSGNI